MQDALMSDPGENKLTKNVVNLKKKQNNMQEYIKRID